MDTQVGFEAGCRCGTAAVSKVFRRGTEVESGVGPQADMGLGSKFEIGRILYLKFEIRNRKLDLLILGLWPVQSDISDFGFEIFEMQDSSNFKISPPRGRC